MEIPYLEAYIATMKMMQKKGKLDKDFKPVLAEFKAIKEALSLGGVGQRTFLFGGWYAGEKFEIKIKAVDRESAIADFETTWIHHKWSMTEEIDQYVAQRNCVTVVAWN